MPLLAHIIDSDHRRRAQLAREMFSRELCASIYDSLEEFLQSAVDQGIVFVSGEEMPALIVDTIRSSRPLPVIVYAERPAAEDIVDAIQMGALDFLKWPLSAAKLDAVIDRIAQQSDRRVQALLRQAAAKKAIARLTSREQDVLIEILKGASNKEAGKTLEISSRTVEIHRGNMMRKLNAQSPATAVRIAILAGLDEEIDLR